MSEVTRSPKAGETVARDVSACRVDGGSPLLELDGAGRPSDSSHLGAAAAERHPPPEYRDEIMASSTCTSSKISPKKISVPPTTTSRPAPLTSSR
jgi:hypothetical protein